MYVFVCMHVSEPMLQICEIFHGKGGRLQLSWLGCILVKLRMYVCMYVCMVLMMVLK